MKQYISRKFDTVIINDREYNVNLFVMGDEEHTMPRDCCCLNQYLIPCETYCLELGYSKAVSEAIFFTEVNN